MLGAWCRSHSSRSTMIAPYDGRVARTSSRSKRVPCARKREHSRACWPGWSRHVGLHSGHPQPGHVLSWPRTSRAQHTRHTGTHSLLALSTDCHTYYIENIPYGRSSAKLPDTRSLGHLVIRSLGHLITQSLGSLHNSVTLSLCLSVSRSLGLSVTWTSQSHHSFIFNIATNKRTRNIRIYRSASQTKNDN